MEGVTREKIKPLLELQQVDLALERLRQRKADLPEQRVLDDLTAQRADAQKSAAERQEAFDRETREQKRLEDEIGTLEQKIARETERLYSGDIANPKELAAIQAELDGLRRRKNHVEDQLLDAMESREAAEAALNEITQALSDLGSKITDATTARDTAAVEIQGEFSKNENARAEIAPLIPGELLDLYDDLRAKKNGVGAARLEGGVCRGCGVSSSPLALDAMRRSDDVTRCENCRRILIVQ